MYSILFVVLSSFLICLITTPLVRDFFLRRGLVDAPDMVRKRHLHSVPRFGGIALLVSYVGALALLIVLGWKAHDVLRPALPSVFKLVPAGLAIFLTGLFDDLFGLRPRTKLLGQFGAAVLACLAGVNIFISAGQVQPWYSIPATIVWLLACSNAFNLIDGLDGLATGIGIFATAAMLISAIVDHNVVLALLTAPLLGSLIGFLRYNFNPASIFLGDCGSLTIGFLLGCFGVLWGQGSAGVLGMAAPFMAMFIPFLDTGLAITRRFVRSHSIFAADARHIHHQLLSKGLHPRRAALLLYAGGCAAACLSLVQAYVKPSFGAVVLFAFIFGVAYCVRFLGYTEFKVLGRLLLTADFRRMVDSYVHLRSFEDSLRLAKTPEECWDVLREACREFDFAHVRACIRGREFEARLAPNAPGRAWYLSIPLPDGDFIDLERTNDSSSTSSAVSCFAESLQTRLADRIPELKESNVRVMSQAV